MRYELDTNGYVKTVVWGCSTGNCAEYTGTVPEGYADLTEWSEKAIINAYYINGEGNLTLDSNRLAELEAQIEQETIENQPVLYKDLYGTNNVLADQYQKLTAEDSVIEAENVKKINPEVFITNISSPKIDIVTQGKQMLKNDAKTEIGKNYLKNITSYTWIKNANATTEIGEDYIKVIMPETVKSASGVYLQSWGDNYTNYTNDISSLQRKQCVYSFYAKADTNRQIQIEPPGLKKTFVIHLTTEWQRYSFIVDNLGQQLQVPTFYCSGSLETASFYVKDIMLEEGDTLSNYEPYFAITKGLDGSITIDGTPISTNLVDFNIPTSMSSDGTYSFENDILTYSSAGTIKYSLAGFNILELIKNNAGKTLCFHCESLDTSKFNSTSNVVCQLKVENNGTTSYIGMQRTSEDKASYTIPEDTTNITLAEFNILTQAGTINGESTIIINKPMLYFGTLDNPPAYEPYLESIEYNICGGSNNTSSIFALKKDMDYYLDLGELECSMKYYDGTTRSIVYEGIDGVINLSDDSKEVTQVTLKIPTGVTYDNKVIYPMLNYGEFPYEYEEYKCKKLTVDLSDHIAEGTTINNIHIKEGQVYVRVNGEDKYLDKGNVNLFDGYNLVYPMQRSTIEMTYTINILKLEGTKTQSKNFEILEDGSMVAHNGSFSGKITATEGEIGGFSLGDKTFTSDIVTPADFTTDDVTKVQQYILGNVTLTDEELKIYDLNEDGEVTPLDYVEIKNLISANISVAKPGSVEINSKNVIKTISIKDGDGNEQVNLSFLGVKSKEYYVIDDSGNSQTLKKSIIDAIYPVGSIYTSVNSTSPATLFGGTWERIQGYFLLAANDKYEEYQAGKTGGSVNHSHGYGSLYAAMYNSGTTGHYYKTKTGVSFTANELKKDTGAGATSTKACTEGTQIYGNTGSANGMPPFLAVYIWKRTA